MLFRTVYGPELASIYDFVYSCPVPVGRSFLHKVFLARNKDNVCPSSQSVDDGLAFLASLHLVAESDGCWSCRDRGQHAFPVLALRQLSRLGNGSLKPQHPLDPLYWQLLIDLFIRPDRTFITPFHKEANALTEVKTHGGLSREKVQAWQRVMEYFGLGWRSGAGFVCVYSPGRVLEICNQWQERSGPLQEFLETHFGCWLPFETATGDIAQAVSASLWYLHQRERLVLSCQLDSPYRAYMGEHRFRFITINRPQNAP